MEKAGGDVTLFPVTGAVGQQAAETLQALSRFQGAAEEFRGFSAPPSRAGQEGAQEHSACLA